MLTLYPNFATTDPHSTDIFEAVQRLCEEHGMLMHSVILWCLYERDGLPRIAKLSEEASYAELRKKYWP